MAQWLFLAPKTHQVGMLLEEGPGLTLDREPLLWEYSTLPRIQDCPRDAQAG